MVIEWLKFRVAPEDREKFIHQDAETWTAFLAEYPGFLGKDIWINPQKENEIILVIRWQTRQQWKAVPIDKLQKIETQFAKIMQNTPYEMIETAEYQVRKFSSS